MNLDRVAVDHRLEHSVQRHTGDRELRSLLQEIQREWLSTAVEGD